MLMLTELVKLEIIQSKSKRRIPVSKTTWVIHDNFTAQLATFHPLLLEKKLHPRILLLASKNKLVMPKLLM